ncbi:hypothetical protein [Promicromonospora panici]|uniref:hypothetical protein n=1 Tax=Promicromonospora panici TaxID=2219658 RepID=UPI00101D8963|nr:hypothetical protein [Promicromonospora panici]
MIKSRMRRGGEWRTALVVAAIVVVSAGCAASTSDTAAGGETPPILDPTPSLDPASAESCALLSVEVTRAADEVTSAFGVLDEDPRSAVARLDDAALSFAPENEEWAGEAAAAADLFDKGLDDLSEGVRVAVDDSTVDVAGAQSTAATFADLARSAMKDCQTGGLP